MRTGRIEQGMASAIVGEVVEKYKKNRHQYDQADIDRAIAESHRHLEKFLRSNPLHLKKSEIDIFILETFEKSLSGELIPKVREALSQRAKKSIPFLSILDKLNSRIDNILNNNVDFFREIEKDNRQISSAARKLKKFGEEKIWNMVLDHLPKEFANIDLREFFGNIQLFIQSAASLASACKTVSKKIARLNFDVWLMDEIDKLNVLNNEIDKYKNMSQKSLFDNFSEKTIEKIQQKIHANTEDLSLLTLDKYRKLMHKKLVNDNHFSLLSEDKQKNLLLILDLKHLQLLRDMAEKNIQSRLHIEMVGAAEGRREQIKNIVLNRYRDYDDNIAQNLVNIIRNPSPNQSDIDRAEAIQIHQRNELNLKTRKMLSRALYVVGLGFAVFGVIAAFAAFPPLTIALIGAGALISFLLAKLVDKNESLTNISRKGFRAFMGKVLGEHSDTEKMSKKHEISSDSQLKDRVKLIQKYKNKCLFEKYKLLIKIDEAKELAIDDIEKLLATENITKAERNIVDRIKHRKNGLMTDVPDISFPKKYLVADKLYRSMKKLEGIASKLYDDLPMDQINTTANQFANLTTEAMGNGSLQSAAVSFGQASLVKFKKRCGQAIAMSMYLVAAVAKCRRASKMLQFDYWLKATLVERHQVQNELAKLKGFIASLAEKPLDRAGLERLYNDLFPQQSQDRDILSSNKFRQELEGRLLNQAVFLNATADQQIYMIAMLEKMHLEHKLIRCEEGILARVSVQLSAAKYREQADLLVKHLNNRYLAYDIDSNGAPSAFRAELTNRLLNPTFNPKDVDVVRNEEIQQNLKEAYNNSARKMSASLFLTVFYAATLVSLVVGFTLLAPYAAAALIAVALAAAVIATLISKKTILKDIPNKSIKEISVKVHKQFTMWGVKEKMGAVPPDLEEGAPSLAP